MIEQWCEFNGNLINLDNVVMVMPGPNKVEGVMEFAITKFCFIGGQSYDLEMHYSEAKETINKHMLGLKDRLEPMKEEP